MTRLFITSTGTGIGKTWVTAALAAAAIRSGRSVLALKPVMSGFEPEMLAESDAGMLMAAQGLGPAALDLVSPWRYRAPLSPDMAAAREGARVPVDKVIGFCRDAVDGLSDVVLIEGVGGVMVPLDEQRTVRDWIAGTAVPVVLVAGSYLGTLSHTLTALAALGDLPIRAIVVSESPDQPVPLAETISVLRRFAGPVPVLAVARRDGLDSWRDVPELASLLDPP
jgi:dethiobiotin synthetase